MLKERKKERKRERKKLKKARNNEEKESGFKSGKRKKNIERQRKKKDYFCLSIFSLVKTGKGGIYYHTKSTIWHILRLVISTPTGFSTNPRSHFMVVHSEISHLPWPLPNKPRRTTVLFYCIYLFIFMKYDGFIWERDLCSVSFN